ncbi:hypothetical protein HYT02_03720 [Candidatus Gottesmanbacteria bacterium]|nr:hypothetical protein [Candidatus Gottesmanbacteria bacterium]
MAGEKRPYSDPTADQAITTADIELRKPHDFFFADPTSNRIVAFTIKPPKPKSVSAFTSQHALLGLLNQKGSIWQPITHEDYRKLQKEDPKRQISWKKLRPELQDTKSKPKKS